jgi:hypothetical protein
VAIDVNIAAFLKRLVEKNIIQPGQDVLELGESELIGDPEDVLAVLKPVLSVSHFREGIVAMRSAQNARSHYQRYFGTARALYQAVFAPRSYLSIDGSPRPRGIRTNLNAPFEIGQVFGYVINNGTSEHVFNQANVHKLIHDHTAVGGVMIHQTPGLGWIDHGLFHAQPGFFFDLANANDYRIAHLELLSLTGCSAELRSRAELHTALKEYPALYNSLICAALVRTSGRPFRMPFQGVYDSSLETMPEMLGNMSSRRSSRGRPNLALRKPAIQSSTSEWSWSDDPALDAAGGNDGLVTGYYGFHTNAEQDPWWQVDLCQPEYIGELVIFNRIDPPALAARAARLRVSTSLDGENWQEIFRRSDGAPFGGVDGNPLRVQLSERVRARFVRVQSMGRDCLHLDEIEIY